MKAGKEISAVIHKHRESAHIDSRYVVGAPTHEFTALATPELKDDLTKAGYSFDLFHANVKEHRDYGKVCLSFVVFGSILTKEEIAQEGSV